MPTLAMPPAQKLICHPASPAPELLALQVLVNHSRTDGLSLSFRLQTNPACLIIPAPLPVHLADGLWQHTCFELFVAAEGDTAYEEFNFSPSGQWAHYRFTEYRQRDGAFAPSAAPDSRFEQLADGCRLDAQLPARLLPAAPILHIGLTAVIEHADGRKSYWALAHDAPQPDFHRRASFNLPLNLTTP